MFQQPPPSSNSYKILCTALRCYGFSKAHSNTNQSAILLTHMEADLWITSKFWKRMQRRNQSRSQSMPVRGSCHNITREQAYSGNEIATKPEISNGRYYRKSIEIIDTYKSIDTFDTRKKYR
jgi:hypothetical protein